MILPPPMVSVLWRSRPKNYSNCSSSCCWRSYFGHIMHFVRGSITVRPTFSAGMDLVAYVTFKLSAGYYELIGLS